jgi:uncharacterized membrane protein YkvA (DUF1232 family)
MPLWGWAIVVAACAVAALALAGWWFVRSLAVETRALAARVGRLPWRAKASLAWALFRDRRVPLWVRAAVPALVLYLASPIDIIPDFIPVLGQLDDLLVVALVVGVFLRFTPRAVLEEQLRRLEMPAIAY